MGRGLFRLNRQQRDSSDYLNLDAADLRTNFMRDRALNGETRRAACGRMRRKRLGLAWPAALVGVVVLAAWLGTWVPVSGQDRTPAPEQAVDFCLVSISAERDTVRVGEPLRLWLWGVGVTPNSWELAADGAGSVILREARATDSWAELVELTVTGGTQGRVTLSVNMACEQPGDDADSLTLTVLTAKPESSATLSPEPIGNFCAAQLSVSDAEVATGDRFYVWFAGLGTKTRAWNLTMTGDGAANLVGTRELDPEYVEWELEAVAAGTLLLTATMECVQPGNGVSSGEVTIVASRDESSEANPFSWSWTPRTVATIELALVVVLLAVIAALIYLVIRRR